MTTYLLLHGFTGAPESWDELALPTDARVLRPALAGHGPSPAPASTWDAEIARLAELLEVEGATDVHLVGYSMGGRLGWGLLQRTDRVTRATLIGAHPGLEDDYARVRRRAEDERWRRLLGQGLAAFVERWEALPLWRTQLGLDPNRLIRQRAIREQHDPAALAAAMRALGLAEMPRTDPTKVRCPVTLVVGGEDHKHRAIAERFAPLLDDARISVFEGAGHNVLLERPDALREVILR